MAKFDIPWPGNKDKAFKEGLPWDPTVASLDGWVKYHGCDALLLEAYKESADIIISHIEGGKIDRHPDIYFFPIAYLYRHGIELFLKKFIQHGIQLQILQEDEKLKEIMNDHKLYPLWNKARIVLEEVWPDGDKNDLKNVERLIQEFHNIDPSGQNLRYSKDKAGKPTTEKLPPSVNLSELKKTCDGLFGFFYGCDIGLSEAKNCQDYY